MAPNSSKHYPITTSVFSYISPSSCKHRRVSSASCQLDSSTSLAHLGKNHVDSYIKQIIRHLKNLVFKKLPDAVVSKDWSVFAFNQGAPGLNGTVKIEELMQVQPSSMLEALTFLNVCFLHSQNLLTNITEFCKTPQIDEPELSKLKKLKEHLVELTGFLDKVLMLYSHVENTSNLPSVKDVKRLSKKLGKMIRKIEPRSFHQFTPITAVTEEDILCSVLGLQRDVADRLRRLNPVVRSHQTDMYFLQHFLADQDVNPNVDECFKNVEAVSSKLQEMGFTQSRSVAIADWIEKQPWAEHQSLLAWAQHYIESLFTYDMFLTECVHKYPYKENKVNEWFSVPVERDDNDEGEIATNVQVINTTEDKLSKLIEEKEQQCQQQPGQRLYYHGTDHNSAKSLLEDGIKLEKGKPCCDFSDGKGFYVADDATYAFEWAKKSKALAVVMFTITDDCLNRKFKGLDLSSADRKSDWEMIKNYFRKENKQLSANRKLWNECNKSAYVKGPISRDGTEQNRYQNVQQICIRKDGMAEDVGNLTNICGVVFINAT